MAASAGRKGLGALEGCACEESGAWIPRFEAYILLVGGLHWPRSSGNTVPEPGRPRRVTFVAVGRNNRRP